MKRILILSILMSLLTILPTVSNAFDIHDVSGNYTVLVNMTNGKFFSAPSIDATLATAFDETLKLNIKVAFPTSKTYTDEDNKSILAGPFLGINIINLISKVPKVVIVEGVSLEAGAGVLFAVSAIDGLDMRDWKEITFPGGSIGISF